MKIIFREWWKDKKACALMVAFMIVSIVEIILNARVVILISNCLSDLENFGHHLTVLLGVCVIQIVLSGADSMFRQGGIHHCYTRLSNLYADKVIDADADMFTKYSCAYINTMSEYIYQIVGAGNRISGFIVNISKVVTTLISIYLVGGAMVIPVIIIYGIGAIVGKKLFSVYEKIDKETSVIRKDRNQAIENVVNGFMEVRSFMTQKWHRKLIGDLNGNIYKGMMKRTKVTSITNVAFESIDTAGLVAIILYSVKRMAENTLSQVNAMSLVMYVFRIIEPLSYILDFMDVISQDVAMTDKYDVITSYKNTTRPAGTLKLDKFEREIEMKNVSFSYENSSNILRNISMKFPKGKKIGICGVSGAGKSTLFKLLNRFYDADSGDILIDGIDINTISKESYRSHIGSVHQDNSIFPGTIKDNIIYGNFDVPEFEMIEASKKAHLYDFIMSLPQRFETQVGPRGLTLSGGQKQRIALARLFLSNPDIILLDEATSALDNESETFIQDALDALDGKTLITVAHRLSTIRNSDIIYVMGPEGIVEQGTHDELMDLKGEYFKMNK